MKLKQSVRPFSHRNPSERGIHPSTRDGWGFLLLSWWREAGTSLIRNNSTTRGKREISKFHYWWKGREGKNRRTVCKKQQTSNLEVMEGDRCGLRSQKSPTKSTVLRQTVTLRSRPNRTPTRSASESLHQLKETLRTCLKPRVSLALSRSGWAHERTLVS